MSTAAPGAPAAAACPDGAAILAALDAALRDPAADAALLGWRSAAQPLAQLAVAALLILRGRVDEARPHLDAAESTATSEPARLAAAALRFERGEFSAALEALERAGGATALDLESAFASQLGWHRDALIAAEALIHREPARADAVHRHLQQLLTAEGDAAAALEHLRRQDGGESGAPARAWAAARLHAQLGAWDEVVDRVQRALALSDNGSAAQRDAAALLLEAGAFDAAAHHATLAAAQDPTALEPRLLLAQLRLWRGDADAALALSEQILAGDPQCSAAQRQRGAALLLLGRGDAALAALDAALQGANDDPEAHAWRAEALLRLGRVDEAAAALRAHPRQGDSAYWVVALLAARAAVAVSPGRLDRLLARLAPRLARTPVRAGQYELSHALADLVPGAAARLARPDPQARRAVLDAALAALAGNRSARPTVLRADGSLAYLAPHAPRHASVRALGLIKTAPPEQVLRALDAVIATYPDSSLPITYRGELRLWLGDYAAARADLEAALAQRRTTRWAYYGLASLANVEARPRDALALCARSVRVMRGIGPAIHVHRGEALRRLGRTAAARRELRQACAVSPQRLSGRLNLALADGDAGDIAAEAAGFAWLRDQAPGLVGDAAFELGGIEWTGALSRDATRALLERMLVMMRGNRASSFATWIGSTGQVRVAGASSDDSTALARWRADAPRRWQDVRRLLQRAASGKE